MIQNATVQLKFDYLNKEKMFREYIMENETICEVSFIVILVNLFNNTQVIECYSVIHPQFIVPTEALNPLSNFWLVITLSHANDCFDSNSQRLFLLNYLRISSMN